MVRSSRTGTRRKIGPWTKPPRSARRWRESRDQPLLAGPLSPANAPAETAPGEAFTVVMALLRLERQARHHEIVAHRARLQALSAPLFAAYMATR